MKRANFIIEHIKNLPQFKLMNQYYCCRRFISLLPPRFQKVASFAYLRDDTLFLAISHPGFKMELNSKIDFLKSILRMVREGDEKCKNFKASRIVIFNSKLKSIRERKNKKESLDTVPYYAERAKSLDTSLVDDEDLKRVFEKIREHIENGVNRADKECTS